MIRLAKNSPCENCIRDIGIKQPNGTEQGEHFYCDAYKRIPDDIACGKGRCDKQIKEDQ